MNGNEIFARKRIDDNYDILASNGEPVTQFPFAFPLVWPIHSSLSAYYEHPDGIILSRNDVEKLGIEIEK